jgi:hypothetical protein
MFPSTYFTRLSTVEALLVVSTLLHTNAQPKTTPLEEDSASTTGHFFSLDPILIFGPTMSPAT